MNTVRWIRFPLAIGVAVLLASCSKSEQVTLTLLGENTSNLEAIATIVDEYRNETGVRIDVQPHTFEDALNKSTQDFANGTGRYDIVMQYNFALSSFVRNRWVWTLDELGEQLKGRDLGFEDKLFDRAWQEVGFYYRDPNRPGAGKMKVGYPFATNTMLLVYNKNLLEDGKHQSAFRKRYGESLQAPITWEQYRNIAEYFTQPDANLAGVCLEGSGGGWLYYEFTNFLFGRGAKVLQKEFGWEGTPETAVVLDSEAAKGAAEFFLGLRPFNAGNFFSTDQFEKRRLMLRGNVAMAFMWSDTVPGLLEAAREKGVDFGFAPIPGQVSILAGGAFFINRKTRHLMEALDFILYVLQEDTQKKLAARGLSSGMATAYEDRDVRALPYSQALRSSLERGVYMLEAGPDAEIISNVITKHLQEMWLGELSPEEAVRKAASAIQVERVSAFKRIDDER